MSRCPLALTLLLASLSAQACELPPPPAGRPPALPAPLYHVSKLGQDPQATAQALFKNIPPAEADKRYEVVVSVRELPPQPIRLQPTAAPLKGQ
ncbi:hypothetical protein [Aeromonas hydrophila]|uniref:hypothetical protein n=1 Tax=Aeromonas hydrophila TaxID=644 RepID=UPI002B498990|nr:hypothetical protein [Aeromonas hydrophila]